MSNINERKRKFPSKGYLQSHDGETPAKQSDRRIVVSRTRDVVSWHPMEVSDLKVVLEKQEEMDSEDVEADAVRPVRPGVGGRVHALQHIASYDSSGPDDDEDDKGHAAFVNSLRSVVVTVKTRREESAAPSPALNPKEIRLRAERDRRAKLEALKKKKKEVQAKDEAKEKKEKRIDDLRRQLEIKKIKKQLYDTDDAIEKKDSQINKIKKVRAAGEGMTSTDKEMLQARAQARPDPAALEKDAQILRLRGQTKGHRSPKSEDEILRLRSVSKDEELLRLRRKAHKDISNGDSAKRGKARTRSASDSEAESRATAADESKIIAIRSKNAGSGDDSFTEIQNIKSKLSATDSKLKKLQSKRMDTSDGVSDIGSNDKAILRIRKNHSSSSLDRLAANAADSKVLKLREKSRHKGNTDSGAGEGTMASNDTEVLALRRNFSASELSDRSSGLSFFDVFNPDISSVDGCLADEGSDYESDDNTAAKRKQRIDLSAKQKTKPAATSRYEQMLGAESEKKKEEQRKALRANINKVANLYRDEKKAEVQDHNDPSLTYQERLDALRGKCGHLYRKSGSLGLQDINWRSGNWKAKFAELYGDLKTPYIDTHCHIDFLFQRTWYRGSFEDYLEENSETVPSNFAGCVAVFCEPSTYFTEKKQFLSLMDEPKVYGAVGVHPKSASQWDDRVEKRMRTMLQHDKIVALGEIGLDYSGTFYREKAIQKRVFRRQLEIAVELDLPIVIHCRDAEEDCIDVLESTIDRNHTIHRHCWTGSWEECEIWMDKFPNSFVGLTPLVTQSTGRADTVREVAARLPLDKLLLETDAPYFVPGTIPNGAMKFSHPALSITVAAEVAALQDVDVEKVLKQVRKNTAQMYGINPSLS